MGTGCKQATQMLARLHGAGKAAGQPSTADWIAARARHAVPVDGPRKPELLWKYEAAGMKSAEVFSAAGGDVYLGCTGVPALKGVPDKDAFHIDMHLDGGHVGTILHLDANGRLAGQVELPNSPDGKQWSFISYSSLPGPAPRIIAVCVRVDQAKLHAMYQGQSETNWSWAKQKGVYLTQLYSFDAQLHQQWTAALPDYSPGILAAATLLADGSALLEADQVKTSGQDSPGGTSEFVRFDAAGRPAPRVPLPADPHNQSSFGVWFAAGRDSTYCTIFTDTLLKFGGGAKIAWQHSFGKRLLDAPLILPDGGTVVLTEDLDLTWNVMTDMDRHDTPQSTLLYGYTPDGKERWNQTVGWLRGGLAADDKSNLYYVALDDDGLRDAEHERIEDELNNIGKSPPRPEPAHLQRHIMLHVLKEDSQQHQVWDYARTYDAVDDTPSCHDLIVDHSGTCYAQIEHGLIGVNSAGKELFALDLTQYGPRTWSRLDQTQSGRIYLTSGDNTVIALGDKPAGAT